MFDQKIQKILKVMSLHSTAFSEYFHMLMTVHNIKSIRNGTKVLIIYFCSEIIVSHMGERSMIFKPIIALVAFCVFTLIYVVTANVDSSETMISISSVMVVMCMSYSVILASDQEEMIEGKLSLMVANILMMFTLFHLRFLITLVLSIIYILIFLSAVNYRLKTELPVNVTVGVSNEEMNTLTAIRQEDHHVKYKYNLLVAEFILFFAVYLVGLYLRFFNSIRRKSAFLKLAQNAQAKMKMESAVEVQIYWIEAIMPSAVKTEFLENVRYKDLFNLVYCRQFKDVSILFADIVGFTAMSSNKTAKQLVYLLNDLYNRFDDFGKITNCEKIATLGDCYYCVSGCPVPRSDHAMCCVEMGLGMCKMILTFNKVHREEVNMRVGVHSGRVIAAIIGNSRFRFDVYSNDVSIANALESSGKPGKVHISEKTFKLVCHAYTFVEGEKLMIKKERRFGLEGFSQALVPISTYFVESVETEYDEYFNRSNLNESKYYERYSEKLVESQIPLTMNDKSSLAFKMRDEKMKNDLELIRHLQSDPEKTVQFFQRPPLNPFTMTFTDIEIESHFQFHLSDHLKEINIDSVKIALLFDAIACQVYSTFILISSNVLLIRSSVMSASTILTYLSGLIMTFISGWICLVYKSEIPSDIARGIFIVVNHPISRLFIGIYVSSFPTLLVYTLYNQTKMYDEYEYTVEYFTLIFFSLISNCIFTGSYSIIKQLSTAICTATSLYILLKPNLDRVDYDIINCEEFLINTLQYKTQKLQYFYGFQLLQICLLIYYLTQENEKNIRIFFYASREAEIRNDEARRERKVAERFLYNIIPKYVFFQITGSTDDKKTNKFSYAHTIPNAGVVFASISNFFSGYYREDYKRGLNALKVLHNIICGFDNLLRLPLYKGLEKIKTVNDCYMMASGLNASSKAYREDHLYKLMLFSFDLLNQLAFYNEENIIGNKHFYLKIGYNFGPVTAGIIGTTKPLYDIWGDTVNVASRMYSTAPAGKIQVSGYVQKYLATHFQFEYRGSVFMKGKGDVETYLAVKPFETYMIYKRGKTRSFIEPNHD